MTAELSAAAQALRDSVDALPEPIRSAEPWTATDYGGEVWWVDAGGVSIANCGQGETAQRIAEHLAAAGNAARQLPALLDAIATQMASIKSGWLDQDIDDAAEALAAAITRSPSTVERAS